MAGRCQEPSLRGEGYLIQYWTYLDHLISSQRITSRSCMPCQLALSVPTHRAARAQPFLLLRILVCMQRTCPTELRPPRTLLSSRLAAKPDSMPGIEAPPAFV